MTAANWLGAALLAWVVAGFTAYALGYRWPVAVWGLAMIIAACIIVGLHLVVT